MCTQLLIEKFQRTVEQGPVYTCTSCKQLFYKHSVSIFTNKCLKNPELQLQIPVIVTVDDKQWICATCKNHLSKGKIPPMSTMNKMVFTRQGLLKNLNPLEQTLLSVRIPFMKIHEAARGRQKFIHGNMVLVPADVDNTVTQLPRLTSNDETIKATLKRRLRYKHNVYRVNIRPELVGDCAEILSNKSLYKEHVTFNNNWTDSEDQTETLSEQPVYTPAERDNDKAIKEHTNSDDDDGWSETEDEPPVSGLSDTLLSAQDFIEPGEREKVYNFAPGEGAIPVSVFLEQDIEELAFPAIFCCERRAHNAQRPVNVTYGEIVKSELRNADRRAACSIENIFFKTKKIQMKILIDQAQIMVRKVKTNNQTLTVKDIRGEALKNLIHTDKAYKALANVRGSPPYFEKVSIDLFAMIRQLGPATFFLTLSAAETRWTHLLKILGQVVNNKMYSTEEIEALSWEEKCRLIQNDPVTCARHFDYCVSKFLNEFLLTAAAPIDLVEDFFYRVEYQNRGSPHIHMVVWCKDSPAFGTSPEVDICKYIDRYICCTMPDDSDPFSNLVKLQVHRHSHTCKRKKQKSCRFGYPKPIFPKTILLEPLSEAEFTKEEISKHKGQWKKVYAALNNLDVSTNVTYTEFLANLQLNETNYIYAVRSSIRTPTVYLKRTSAEIRVNNYNPAVLKAWRANTDIQFVLDIYACATYVASYLTKSQRGMSELLRNATKEASQGTSDIKQQFKVVGNKFLNAVEISAQEAVYICLQLPMKKASRQVVFVNTSPPEQRVTLLKPKYVLDSMHEDDDDIECSNLLSRYAERPKTLETVTLAEFVSYYKEVNEKHVSRSAKLAQQSADKLLPEPTTYENEDDDHALEMSEIDLGTDIATVSGSKTYRKRSKGHIIRAVHFNPHVDSELNYRELIMLYFPWRKEDMLRGTCHTFFERFQQLETEITRCRQQFEPYAREVDDAQRVLASDPDLEEVWKELAPGTEDENLRNRDMQLPPPETGIENYCIGEDLGLPMSVTEDDLHDLNQMPDHLYREHMRHLNHEQLMFVLDTIHLLKTSNQQIFRFLSGGDGVGKSYVIQALYQSALRYLNKHAGDNFATRSILLLAPTGNAAYHIRGSTIHNGLKISANNKLEHRPLSSGQLNTLRNQIGSIKLLIVDEVSMVGFRMFNCINQRLMEVMQSSKPFGGISTIVVGDLFQLEPVFDSYIFQQPKSGFMPLATNLWIELFHMFELKQIMRQADSKAFAELLNRLREGHHTKEDIQILKDRTIERNSKDYPYNATHLMHKNDDVNAYNAQFIAMTQNNIFTINAKDRIVGSTPYHLQQKILSNFRNSQTKACQLPNVLSICEGIHCDLTINLDTADGLTNGASCQVMKIESNKSEISASGTIWVLFVDELTGRDMRAKNKHLYRRNNWTPIQPVVKQYAAGVKGQAQIQRYQFPLRPSHAKSIHRSQGDYNKKNKPHPLCGN